MIFDFSSISREGNEPAHIQIIGKGGEMKIWLNPIQVAKVYNLNPKEQKAAINITKNNQVSFMKEWRKYHESDS